MSEWSFVTEYWFVYIIIPLLILCARIVDSSRNTMRSLLLNRGHKLLVPLFGFVQALAWILAILQILTDPQNPIWWLYYSAAFAVGNFIGLLLEDKIASGMLTVRIVLPSGNGSLEMALRREGHGVTVLEGEGVRGPVNVLLVVIRRRLLPKIVELIERSAPVAFYSTEEVRSSTGGILMSKTD